VRVPWPGKCMLGWYKVGLWLCSYLSYQPNMHPMALLTIPLFLLGVLVPGTTLFSAWASLYAWVSGLMVRGVPSPVDKLATLLDKMLLSTTELVFRCSRTDVSLQLEMPTMMDPPKTQPFLATALFAIILVCMRTCIQLQFGDITCCSTVPQVDNSDKMKLVEEGGKPHTVTHVSSGEWSGVAGTSCGEVMVGGGDMMLLCRLLEGVEMDLLGVNRRELVGGPPGLSLLERGSEEFSFSK